MIKVKLPNDWFDLNIFLLQHKAIGIGHKFKNLDCPLPNDSQKVNP